MRSFYNQWQRSWLILCSERGPNMLLAKCLQQMTLGIVHSGSGFQHERTISVGYLWADVLLYSWVKSLISTAWSSSYLCMMGKCLMEFWSMYNCKSECCFYLVDYLVDKIIILWGLQQCLLSPLRLVQQEGLDTTVEIRYRSECQARTPLVVLIMTLDCDSVIKKCYKTCPKLVTSTK